MKDSSGWQAGRTAVDGWKSTERKMPDPITWRVMANYCMDVNTGDVYSALMRGGKTSEVSLKRREKTKKVTGLEIVKLQLEPKGKVLDGFFKCFAKKYLSRQNLLPEQRVFAFY